MTFALGGGEGPPKKSRRREQNQPIPLLYETRDVSIILRTSHVHIPLARELAVSFMLLGHRIELDVLRQAGRRGREGRYRHYVQSRLGRRRDR